MSWTNASHPPADARTVLCLMVNGDRVLGKYRREQASWWFRWYGVWIECDFSPVGWRELETRDD